MNWKLSLYLVLSCPILAEVKPTPQRCGCRSGCQSGQSACAPVVPIMLDDCGPNPSPLPPINAPPLQTPLINKPPVALPACVPPAKTIGNTCHCVKTVVKPQVVQQLISVPSIQRYIETTHTPVLEHIHYHGIPINCPPYAPEPPTAPTASATAVSSGPAKPLSLSPYLTLGTAKAPALPCLSLPTPPTLPPIPPPSISPTLLALLASLSAGAASRAPSPSDSPCSPASLSPCLPLSALPSCPASPPPNPLPCLSLPALPPCPSSPVRCLPLSPCLLSLLSKLMLR